MPVRDDLGTRMKTFYENIPKTRLMRRVPVAIRLDGKAFHTFTRGFQKPFDFVLMDTMQQTMKYLCENIQGCVLGYTQSDEISLLLVDYKNLNSSAWFDYEVQKICSIAASMATMAFNKSFTKNAEEFMTDCAASYEMEGLCGKGTEEYKLCEVYQKAIEKGAMFDARCFNIPKEEVTNYFYWRQLDAIRNSIQMVGQAHFPHNILQYKTCEDIKDMLYVKDEIVWELLPTYKQRGSCCIKQDYIYENILRKQWVIDNNIPLFKEEGRDYIEVLVNC